MIRDAEELSNIDQVAPSSESASEYPFVDIEQQSEKPS